MSPENFNAVMNQMCDRRPFQMFTVELNSGVKFQVDHPHAVVFRDGVAVYIAPGRTFYWFDHNSVSHFVDASADTSA